MNIFNKIKEEVMPMEEDNVTHENNGIITINTNIDSKTGPNRGRFTKNDIRINRKGRPPVGKAITEKIRSLLQEPIDPSSPDYKIEDGMIDLMAKEALSGNLNAVQILLNRAYGNTKQSIEVEAIQEEEIDVSVFSDEELYLYLALVEKSENGETPKYHELMKEAKGKTTLDQKRGKDESNI